MDAAWVGPRWTDDIAKIAGSRWVRADDLWGRPMLAVGVYLSADNDVDELINKYLNS